jgi:hypothetical protein
MMDATDNAVLGRFSKIRNPEQPSDGLGMSFSQAQFIANYLILVANSIHKLGSKFIVETCIILSATLTLHHI